MASNLRPPAESGQYRAPKSVRRDGALARYVDAGGSTTLGGAHQKELRLKASLRTLLACLPADRATRFLESARAFIRDVARPVDRERFLAADAADRAEDTAELRYHLDPTPATKETFIRALYAEGGASLALARDLEAQR